MDLITQTSSPKLTGGDDAVAALQVLVDQAAIRDLAVLYSHAVDEHDIASVLATFAKDGEFHRASVASVGWDQLHPFFVGMMRRYSTTLHVVNSHVINVQGDTATGVVDGCAELVFEGTLMVTKYRYNDSYTRIDDRWVFQSRALLPMYTLPWDSVGAGFSDTLRIQWPGQPRLEAAYPETAPTWNTYPDS
jgi:hypothetical protein